MNQRTAFFWFKILEALFSILCAIFHIIGFTDKLEPFPHELYFCGIYFTFILISVLGAIGLKLGLPLPLVLEVILSFAGFITFLVAGLISMMHAEDDIHLLYLTDYEEWYHRYFYVSRLQSITSVAASFMFLLHGILTLDIILIKEQSDRDESDTSIDLDEYEANAGLVFTCVCDPCFTLFETKFPRCCDCRAPDVNQV